MVWGPCVGGSSHPGNVRPGTTSGVPVASVVPGVRPHATRGPVGPVNDIVESVRAGRGPETGPRGHGKWCGRNCNNCD